MKLRSLYDCKNAHWPVKGAIIHCIKGHRLGAGNVNIRQVIRDDKLIFKSCQLCKDYEGMNDGE